MVPSDLRKSNLTVDDILLVRGKIVTPEINVSNLIATNLVVTNDATIPNIDGGGTIPTNIVLTTGDQTVNGIKTFTSGIPITSTTNQLVLGSGLTTTLTATAPAIPSIYTIPDVGVVGSFAMTEGAQTINGAKTFTDATTFGTSILLPTTGGTPTALTYYEEFSGSFDFTSNAFAGTRTLNYQIIRVGSKVTLFVANMPLGAASGAPGTINGTVGTAIPSQFRYSQSGTDTLKTFANITSNSAQNIGTVTISTGGILTVSAGSVSGTTFAATGNNGFAAFSASWTIPGPA